jgi:Fe-S cluster biogenesis protein NfuA
MTQTGAGGTARQVILPEHTPNPDCVKLHVGDLGVERGADFPSREAAIQGSPLAVRLFDLGGVARVFIGPDFVAVTRQPDVDWRGLGGALIEEIRRHLNAGEPVLAPGQAGGASSGDAGEESDPDEVRVREIVEGEIRPLVAQDGGDVLFLSYRAGIVELRLRGACAGCPSAERTLRDGIEARLRRSFPDLVEVVSR